ncbi:hypothetical protein C7451_10812 [Blastomonas natatoria]|uniref:Uncharacterized protein n=1 Tax=Blastomonas natatoria TaxID=34015 RepID=A0A2V3V062_9SPHN|nr:hypothetical protein C7451_10812 [Blastomonas natatoria]
MAFGMRGDSDRDAFIHYVEELAVPEGWKQEAKMVKLATNPMTDHADGSAAARSGMRASVRGPRSRKSD